MHYSSFRYQSTNYAISLNSLRICHKIFHIPKYTILTINYKCVIIASTRDRRSTRTGILPERAFLGQTLILQFAQHHKSYSFRNTPFKVLPPYISYICDTLPLLFSEHVRLYSFHRAISLLTQCGTCHYVYKDADCPHKHSKRI